MIRKDDDELEDLVNDDENIDDLFLDDYDESSGSDEDKEDEDKDNNNDEDDEDDVDELMFKLNTNNHKIEGKHSLARDTIFKGKIEDIDQDFDHSGNPDGITLNEGFPIEIGTSFEFESKYNEDYVGRLNLSQDVYDSLKEKTDLDFSANRRKPNRQAFNEYYKMLLENIGKKYTKSEIFVELSYYFTDNIFNMFKLLDKEYATQIIIDLKKSGYLTNLNNINFI